MTVWKDYSFLSLLLTFFSPGINGSFILKNLKLSFCLRVLDIKINHNQKATTALDQESATFRYVSHQERFIDWLIVVYMPNYLRNETFSGKINFAQVNRLSTWCSLMVKSFNISCSNWPFISKRLLTPVIDTHLSVLKWILWIIDTN